MKQGVEAEMAKFGDGSGGWVDIAQITKDGSSKITINISLKDDCTQITEIGVWEFKLIFDEDNAKKII